jgi:hypothetical protein
MTFQERENLAMQEMQVALRMIRDAPDGAIARATAATTIYAVEIIFGEGRKPSKQELDRHDQWWLRFEEEADKERKNPSMILRRKTAN